MAILEAIPGLWKNVILALDIAGYVFAFLLIPRIILERRHPSATLAWMLGIALLPLIGIPLYFLIGVRRIRRNIRATVEFTYVFDSIYEGHGRFAVGLITGF